MFKEFRKEIEWGGRRLVLESGKIGRQADGSVMATYGETKVLCTVVGEKVPRHGIDFFPLSVHYQEKTFAAGKIPGGFFKREARPSEKETLTSRLIDRPIRPLFADGYKNETQIICTVLSHDMENNPDIVAMIGSSAALTLSGLPFMGPIGGCRVGYIAGKYVLNPKPDELSASELDIVVAGTHEGVLMVESEAKELSEEVMLDAVMFGHKAFQPVIEALIELAEACAKDPWERSPPPAGKEEIAERVAAMAEAGLREAYAESDKITRLDKVAAVKEQTTAELNADESIDQELLAEILGDVFEDLAKDIVRRNILQTGRRIDGRDTRAVRPIAVEVGLLPRSHGSALFTRGETQAIVVTTLGTGHDEQRIDALDGDYYEHFLLHYNFPPYSVGEAGRFGFTGRREVGHGKLAWRAIHPMLPKKEDFPYTIRVVSEITESNGSSSMATVCGTSLALMDAGVPLKRPVAGIAMGLIK
ncbi:MAG: polyribonucleotide nucleotidyltransferase, partial [Rhodospirillales bacterium]